MCRGGNIKQVHIKVATWNEADIFHREAPKWKWRRDTLLRLTKDCDVILLQEVHGSLKDFKVALPQVLGSLFVGLSPVPRRPRAVLRS